jgi:hypothetical protein
MVPSVVKDHSILIFKDQAVQEKLIFLDCLTLEDESFDMSETTKRKEEDLKPQQHHSENVTS